MDNFECCGDEYRIESGGFSYSVYKLSKPQSAYFFDFKVVAGTMSEAIEAAKMHIADEAYWGVYSD